VAKGAASKNPGSAWEASPAHSTIFSPYEMHTRVCTCFSLVERADASRYEPLPCTSLRTPRVCISYATLVYVAEYKMHHEYPGFLDAIPAAAKGNWYCVLDARAKGNNCAPRFPEARAIEEVQPLVPSGRSGARGVRSTGMHLRCNSTFHYQRCIGIRETKFCT
jgi:hypothetical protein